VFLLERRYDVSFEAFEAACASRVRPVRAGDVVLQVGCGTSSWGARLAARGLAVLDSDVDAALLARKGRTRNARSRLCLAALDACALGLRPSCVDFVLDKGTLDALASAADGPARPAAVVRQALAALRPGGALLAVSALLGKRSAPGLQLRLRGPAARATASAAAAPPTASMGRALVDGCIFAASMFWMHFAKRQELLVTSAGDDIRIAVPWFCY
jgi:SAM-dependent methyltransferase